MIFGKYMQFQVERKKIFLFAWVEIEENWACKKGSNSTQVIQLEFMRERDLQRTVETREKADAEQKRRKEGAKSLVCGYM